MGTVSGGSEKSGKTLFDLIAKLFAVSVGYAAGYFMMNGSYYRPNKK